MGKTRTLLTPEGSKENTPKQRQLKIRPGVKLKACSPLKGLLDEKELGAAIMECLKNNDPEGVMEMIQIYIEALEIAKIREGSKLPKSTIYHALKRKNPTIKTLARILNGINTI